MKQIYKIIQKQRERQKIKRNTNVKVFSRSKILLRKKTIAY